MSVEMRALNAISGSHLLLCGRSVAYVGHVRSRCLFSLWSAGRLVPLRGRAESHVSCSRTSAPLRLRTDLLYFDSYRRRSASSLSQARFFASALFRERNTERKHTSHISVSPPIENRREGGNEGGEEREETEEASVCVSRSGRGADYM